MSDGLNNSQNRIAPIVSEADIINIIGISIALRLLFAVCCLIMAGGIFLRKNVRRWSLVEIALR